MTDSSSSLKPIDTPYFTLRSALVYALYKMQLYVDVVKRWSGWGLRYLLLLSCVVALPFSIIMMVQFVDYFKNQLVQPIRELPMITIQKGQMSIEKPEPYIIKNKRGEPTIIINSKKTMSELKQEYPEAMMLFSRDTIYFRSVTRQFFTFTKPYAGQPQVYEQTLDESTNAMFNGATWIDSLRLNRLKYMGLALIYPSVVMTIFGTYVSLLFVLAFLGQVVASALFKISLTFRQSIRMMIVASTAQAYAFMLFLAFQKIPQGLGLFLIGLLFFYYTLGLITLKKYYKALVIR